MGESTKAVCSLIMIVGLIAATLAWLADQPDTTVWGVRIGAPVLALMALGLMLKLHWRQDLEHDYLAERVGSYFNRDGFCFGFVVTPIHGIAYVDAYFQTQYDTPSIGRIALRPTRGFFLTRANIETMTFEVECPPCGFGLIRLAIPIPEKLQAAMETLNDRQRMALLLHRFEGMSYVDIGASMEMTPQAVKSLLSRARNQLRMALEEYIT